MTPQSYVKTGGFKTEISELQTNVILPFSKNYQNAKYVDIFAFTKIVRIVEIVVNKVRIK